MKTITILAGALLGFLVGAALDTAIFTTTGQVFPPFITVACTLVGAGLGVAFATRTRRPHPPIDPARYPNRTIQISRRPR